MIWTKADTVGSRASALSLAALYVITVASLAGFAVFRIWPSLIATIPGAAATYPKAVAFFPRAQIICAFAALAIHLAWRTQWRWVSAAIAVYLLSLSSELSGTTLGLPFGPYHYTDALGVKWLGHVPVLIPFSWFTMALPSLALAGDSLMPRWRRIAIASLILLAWDLSLDPAMSAATAFWVWGTEGSYYGMPWLNLFGWFVTGVVLMTAMSMLGVERWLPSVSRPWMLAFYGANLLLSLGMAAIAGMWWAFAATAGLLAICHYAARPRRVHLRVLA